MVVRAGPVLLLAAAPFLIQIPLTAADTRTAPPRAPGSRAPGTAPSRGYSICINGLGSRCCSGLIVMQIKHSSAENPPPVHPLLTRKVQGLALSAQVPSP